MRGSAGFSGDGITVIIANLPLSKISRKVSMSICRRRSVVFPSLETTLNSVLISIIASMISLCHNISSTKSRMMKSKSKPNISACILAAITKRAIP